MIQYAHTLFCDDIRHEVGNKTTFVGAYAEDIVFAAPPPITMPKLGIVVWVSVPIDQPPKRLSVVLTWPINQRTEFTHPDLSDVYKAKEEKASGDGSTYIIASMFTASPFPIHDEGHLNVVVHADDQEIKAGRLRLRFARELSDSAGP